MSDPPFARLSISGELDLSTGTALLDALDRLAQRGCTCIQVDLDDLEFVDAFSLALLRRYQVRLRDLGGELTVASAPPCYELVRRLAGYDTLGLANASSLDGGPTRYRLRVGRSA